MSHIVRIGGADPIDFGASLSQLVRGGRLHYLLIDWLSEFSLPSLVQRRLAEPGNGFAAMFASKELAACLREILRQKLRIVTNAGGLDPEGCARAVTALAAEQGLHPRIAVISGDDLGDRHEALRNAGCKDLYSGAPLPRKTVAINAYTGALPIAQALAMGADIVIAGRAVDSALALGPLMHEFGWSSDDYDKLAAGTLVGHLLECGPQASGGIFTDWCAVSDCPESGFPIAECSADGTAVVTKVDGTGGLVSIGTISEQATYEIGDPQRYLMPDVTCDFSNVCLEQLGPDRIRVSGARGYPPTDSYKAIAVTRDGWRATVSFVIRGINATAKARSVADTLLQRTDRRLRDMNLGPWLASHVELIGSEASYGEHLRVKDNREIVCRIVLDHERKEAIDLFLRWQRAISVSMAAGIATVPLGSTATEVFRVHSFLLPKEWVHLSVRIGDVVMPATSPTKGGFTDDQVRANVALPVAIVATECVAVPLISLAWARSGDKGDTVNISVIARLADYLPWINAALTPGAVALWFRHVTKDGSPPRVDRFELPGLHALNLLLHGVLGGGGSASMRFDPMGKALGQQLLEFPVPIPQGLVDGLACRP